MYLTARQIEDQLRLTGTVTLKVGQRLTPLAIDLLRAREITPVLSGDAPAPSKPVAPVASMSTVVTSATAATAYWWVGTRSGAAKAALTAVAREQSFAPLPVPEDITRLPEALKTLAQLIAQSKAQCGVAIVDHAGLANVLAGACASLRPCVATTLPALLSALDAVAPNLLIVEPGQLAMHPMRNLILRFVQAPKVLRPEVQRLLQEMQSCA